MVSYLLSTQNSMATNTNNGGASHNHLSSSQDGSPYRHTYYSSQQDSTQTDDVDGNKLVPPIVFAVVIWVLCSRVLAGGRATAGVHVQEGGRLRGGLVRGVSGGAGRRRGHQGAAGVHALLPRRLRQRVAARSQHLPVLPCPAHHSRRRNLARPVVATSSFHA